VIFFFSASRCLVRTIKDFVCCFIQITLKFLITESFFVIIHPIKLL